MALQLRIGKHYKQKLINTQMSLAPHLIYKNTHLSLPTLTPNFVAKPMPIKMLDLPNSALPDLILSSKTEVFFSNLG
jgi:hypothetical protein